MTVYYLYSNIPRFRGNWAEEFNVAKIVGIFDIIDGAVYRIARLIIGML